MRDFFRRVFRLDPKQRITLDEMMAHPLITTIKESDTSSDSIDDVEEIEWELKKVSFM